MDVLEHVGAGADVIVPMANGEPVALLDLLERHNERLEDVRVHQMHALHERPYVHGRYGTFAMGTERLYRWLDGNAAVGMMPVDYVNDLRFIGREPHFCSINATTEVDLHGQCASETVAGRCSSSSGGQADFARGAMYSDLGQGFVMLHSTTRKGRSRIRARLTKGSVVTTLKNTVDNVVTEYGRAELRGKPIAARARALIGIAHPDHREALEREAIEGGIVPRPVAMRSLGARELRPSAPRG